MIKKVVKFFATQTTQKTTKAGPAAEPGNSILKDLDLKLKDLTAEYR